jgi:hypothetical protein
MICEMSVMAGLVPAIYVYVDNALPSKNVDARHVCREDALRAFARA